MTGKTAEIDIGDVESDLRLGSEMENIQSKSREEDNSAEVNNAEDAKFLRMVKVNVKGGGTDGDTVEAVNESSMQNKEGKEDEIDHDPNATVAGVLKESGGGGNDGDDVRNVTVETDKGTVESQECGSIDNAPEGESENDSSGKIFFIYLTFLYNICICSVFYRQTVLKTKACNNSGSSDSLSEESESSSENIYALQKKTK